MLDTDRRRVVLASVFTVVALSTTWYFNNDSAKKQQTDSFTKAPTTTYRPEAPGFVGGDDQPQVPQVINIAVPTVPPSVKAIATFHRYAESEPRGCTAPFAPDGVVLHVTNIDTGQTTTCLNTLVTGTEKLGGVVKIEVPPGVDMVMHTPVFSEIGDVTNAPIPVRVSW